MNTTPETMTKHDFSDLTPPPQIVLAAFGRCFAPPDGVVAIARWGAEQAAERLKGQWPEPITDRPPTEADGDEFGYVMAVDAQGYWHMRTRLSAVEYNLSWLHTPRWQPPAPPTLKEQALKLLPEIEGEEVLHLCPLEVAKIRRALEADS